MYSVGDALLTKYIENTLPSTIIYIPEMKLVRRAAVWDTAREAITRRAKGDGRWAQNDPGASWSAAVSTYVKDVVRYATLSHRWGEAEPTFQDMEKFNHTSGDGDGGPGLRKLLAFCRMAGRHGYNFGLGVVGHVQQRSPRRGHPLHVSLVP